jgi:V/A-type H+/Na+-transporting ATPase subunit I
MPIVSMRRITAAGPISSHDDVLRALQRLGAVEVEDLGARTDTGLQPTRNDVVVREVAGEISRLTAALELARKIRPKKKPMFTLKRRIPQTEVDAVEDRERALWTAVETLERDTERIAADKGRLARLRAMGDLLQPWRDVAMDLTDEGTARVHVWFGTLPSGDRSIEFAAQLAERHPASHLEIFSYDEEVARVAVVVLREEEEAVRNLLKRSGFARLTVPVQGRGRTPAEWIASLVEERAALATGIEALETERFEAAQWVPELEILLDGAMTRLERLQAESRVGRTGSVFVLSGWVPTPIAPTVESALQGAFPVAVEMRKPEPGEDFPVLLKNNRFVQPYEVVTRMFSTPNSSEIDPNPLVAPYFFLLFGMMLGDAGYGLLLALGTAFLIWGVKVQGNMRQMCQFMFQGSFAAIVSGLLFGSFFGDFVSVVSTQRFAFPQLWFDPLKDPIRMMMVAMGIGVVHVFTGLAAKAYILVLRGKPMDAVLDVLPWYMTLVGLGLLFVGGVAGQVGTWLALAGAGTIILFSARDTKNFILRCFKGLYNLYGITGYFSDILSYSRILALALAGSVIAMVVNMMGSIAGWNWIGIPMFILVALGGHGLNLALSTLGAYVHTSRLTYVEFFGKFFEGGGRPFAPLSQKRKHTDVVG